MPAFAAADHHAERDDDAESRPWIRDPRPRIEAALHAIDSTLQLGETIRELPPRVLDVTIAGR